MFNIRINIRIVVFPAAMALKMQWGTLVVDTQVDQRWQHGTGLFGALSPYHPFHVYNYLFGKNECSISQPVYACVSISMSCSILFILCILCVFPLK